VFPKQENFHTAQVQELYWPIMAAAAAAPLKIGQIQEILFFYAFASEPGQ
jgi:hypothetical protein